MRSTIEMVKEFHDKFVDARDIKKVKLLRPLLLQEELDELCDAIALDDRVAMLDALTDIQYILDGTYIAFGMSHLKQSAFEEVHRSNMAKVDANGNLLVREDGKILKPEGWVGPNLKQFFPAQ